MQECKPKCQNLAKAGESWTDLCAWPEGKNCHGAPCPLARGPDAPERTRDPPPPVDSAGCPECPKLDTHSDMDWPEDSPLECKDCDNGYVRPRLRTRGPTIAQLCLVSGRGSSAPPPPPPRPTRTLPAAAGVRRMPHGDPRQRVPRHAPHRQRRRQPLHRGHNDGLLLDYCSHG